MDKKNKNLILALIICLICVAPMQVRADDGPSPVNCTWPKLSKEEILAAKKTNTYSESDKMRGTCKYIGIKDTISIDKPISDKYYLGTHKAIYITKTEYIDNAKSYSEYINLNLNQLSNATNTVKNESIAEGYDALKPPVNSILVDKKLLNDYMNTVANNGKLPNGLKSWTADQTLNTGIGILNKTEFKNLGVDIEKYLADNKLITDKITLFDFDRKEFNYFNEIDYPHKEFYYNIPVSLYKYITTDVKSFDKMIYALNTTDYIGTEYINESKYIPVIDDNSPRLDELSITLQPGKHGDFYTIPVTSPIKSIDNYWKYIMVDDKVSIVWEKAIYTLDDGTTKVSTNNKFKFDNQKTLSLNTTPYTTSSSTSTTATTGEVISQTPTRHGFFEIIIDFIIGVFKSI